MPKWLRFGLIGCGGLVGIIILISACAALVGQNAPPTTPPPPEKEEVKEDEPTPPDPSEATPKKEEAKKEDSGTVTVRVAGDPGTPFQGSYGTPDSLRSVDGATPQEFEVELETGLMAVNIVSATIQKQSQGNEELTVEIVREGDVVKEQSTTAPFGVVSLTADPTELRG